MGLCALAGIIAFLCCIKLLIAAARCDTDAKNKRMASAIILFKFLFAQFASTLAWK